jgi:1,2-dihydroxy-3-keto-5-methylthiopentene dioxygenase
MAVLRIPSRTAPNEGSVVHDEQEIRATLAGFGFDYERWDLSILPENAADLAPADEVLAAFAAPIEEMKQRGGYTTADVIDVRPDTPGLDAMLARFDKEHTHSEDEVRFILSGRGIFFLAMDECVASVEVGPGDMLRVPRGTRHWFTLCDERRIRAVRWFQDTTGWTPQYTGTGVDALYQPLCFGPAYLGPRVHSTLSA